MRNAVDWVTRNVGGKNPAVEINYVEGDATEPLAGGPDEIRFLVHCCNDIGAWGSGFVLAVSNRWPEPEQAYKGWYEGVDTIYRTTGPLQLGEVQFVPVAKDIVVCNLIGQHSIGSRTDSDVPPVRYEAIHTGLAKIRIAMLGMMVSHFQCSFHSPKFGADRAGGDWDLIAERIKQVMGDTGIPSTVYEWKP